MIPSSLNTLNVIEEEIQPSYTYKWDETNNRIIGKIDAQEAVIQAIKKILQTTRYAHVIYSGNYGNDIETLIGKNYDYIVSEIKRITEEALLADLRVKKVSDFIVSQYNVDSMNIAFSVTTYYGEAIIDTEVII